MLEAGGETYRSAVGRLLRKTKTCIQCSYGTTFICLSSWLVPGIVDHANNVCQPILACASLESYVHTHLSGAYGGDGGGS